MGLGERCLAVAGRPHQQREVPWFQRMRSQDRRRVLFPDQVVTRLPGEAGRTRSSIRLRDVNSSRNSRCRWAWPTNLAVTGGWCHCRPSHPSGAPQARRGGSHALRRGSLSRRIGRVSRHRSTQSSPTKEEVAPCHHSYSGVPCCSGSERIPASGYADGQLSVYRLNPLAGHGRRVRRRMIH